ncbi:MAG: HEPN domain-containing protein [Candidatus Omnitrophica bacterium]|nr:HEPN domain-containing protein [Candidatus Omnitrophota bacterium]
MRLRRDVRDWVGKAEEDFAVVQTLVRKRRPAVHDAVCFHAQQCAEKYLKALLTRERIAFPKTHDLLDLLGLAKRCDSALELFRPHLEYLEPYAVNLRYPGERATRGEARRSTRVIASVREALRRLLGLT